MKILIFLLLSPMVFASTIYITESVEIPLRSSSSNTSEIKRFYKTGTKMKLLERENGWVKVNVNGTIGWMTSRYTTDKEPSYKLLNKLSKKYNKLSIKYTEYKNKLKKTTSLLKDFKSKYYKFKLENAKLRREKIHMEKTYADALILEHKNQKISEKNLQLKSEIQLLKQNMNNSDEQSNRNWFLVGGLVLFLGVILGAILPNLFSRKQNNRF
ncbi:hypothetical protein MNB_SUP05-5-632 [hydrothermal vent metagenome]|uniref:SH3b domain-containing protein n=1 Tax=hydrothermal vent metagenome TaxID=652676 RepID=A0A1W1C8L7_9ZZZZ